MQPLFHRAASKSYEKLVCNLFSSIIRYDQQISEEDMASYRNVMFKQHFLMIMNLLWTISAAA